MFDPRDELKGAEDGIIRGWLSKEDSHFFAPHTGEPAALWRLVYDNVALGEEDLEEHEVLEAIDLISAELPACIAAQQGTLRTRLTCYSASSKDEAPPFAREYSQGSQVSRPSDGGGDFEASSVFRYVPQRKYGAGGMGGDGTGGKEAKEAEIADEAEEAGSQKFSPGAWLRKRQVQQARTTRTRLQHPHTPRTTSTRTCENEERTWNTRFEQLKLFMEQHQHDHVSRASGTGLTGRASGDKLLPLWIWVGKQRNAHALGNLLSLALSLALSLSSPPHPPPPRACTHLYV